MTLLDYDLPMDGGRNLRRGLNERVPVSRFEFTDGLTFN